MRSFTAFLFPSVLAIGIFGSVSQVLVQAEDIKIYGVKDPAITNQIYSFSILGVSAISGNGDGVTKYAVSEVESLFVLQDATTTTTIFSTPTTVFYTIEQGATVFNLQNVATATGGPSAVVTPVLSVDQQCRGDSSGVSADCVQVINVGGNGVKTAATTTSFKGQLTPIFTITGVSATPSPSKSSASRTLRPLASIFSLLITSTGVMLRIF